jgi:hypothetical protein
MECYKEVTSVLDHLYDQRTSSSYAPSVPVCPGISMSQDTVRISQSEASDQVSFCLCLYLHSSPVVPTVSLAVAC